MALEPTLRSLLGPILHPAKVTGNPRSMLLGLMHRTRAEAAPSRTRPAAAQTQVLADHLHCVF